VNINKLPGTKNKTCDNKYSPMLFKLFLSILNIFSKLSSNSKIINKNKIVRIIVNRKIKKRKFPILLFVEENLTASRLKPVSIPEVTTEKK